MVGPLEWPWVLTAAGALSREAHRVPWDLVCPGWDGAPRLCACHNHKPEPSVFRLSWHGAFSRSLPSSWKDVISQNRWL